MKIKMNCEECPFRGGVKVPGEGCTTIGDQVIAIKEDRQYDVAIVGMAPAREEVEQGRVLVGVSGQILRKHLFQMGIKDYYVCNVLLCPITDDSLVPLAVKCCRSVVEEVLSKKPILTIALGDLPLHTLAPSLMYNIMECEGRVLPSLVGPMLPLTHPAYYWRNPDKIFDFTECLRSGIRFLKNKYTQAGEPTLEIINNNNLSKVLQEVDRYEDIAVDLETTGFQAYGWEPDTILEMGLAVNPNHAYIVPKKYISEFKEILETKETRWWNAQFDCAFLRQIGIKPKVTFDGLLAHYSLDERPYSHGLKRVSQIYLGTEDWEKDINKYLANKKTSSYANIPTDVRYKYLSKDVTRTYQLCDVLEDYLNNKVFYEILMPACRMFIEVEERGMPIDPIKMIDLDNILDKELTNLEYDIYKESGIWINPNSSTQVSKFIYDRLGLPIDPYFGRSTSKGYLNNFRETYPIVGKILDYREISKLKGGYVGQFARFIDKSFRIHPNIKITAAITGRLASEKPSIMNIKSIKDLKRLFLPFENNLLGYYDIKQNELRWYCIISGDEELSEILRKGGDPHNEVAVAAYGEERAKAMRGAAKGVVFGRIYGRGRPSIERQVGRGVIDEVMTAVDDIAPNIDKYYKWIKNEVKTKGYLESYFGRKRRFSLITPDSKSEVERQAVNFPIQSSGSDLMLICMLHLWKMKDILGIWPFWPLHDSITISIPDIETLKIVKGILEDYSYNLVNGVMPFVWKEDWGYNWALDKEPPNRVSTTISIKELEKGMEWI